ncbi:Protein CBG26720 [Caenorhabditis briggsae]|uniref:Protein CBG26720 n=1 Tax=Caenorhabditis briggsae TaxID=6238 RepID=B6IE93_CAEBR|nr:Protein CBG26720 [Caenorhabditis briggsae]CAS01157.1 Protein CBG26720 [Caenorhabditis briggsae]
MSKSPGPAKSPQKNVGKAKNRKTFKEKGKSTKLRRKKKKKDDEGPKVQKSRTSEEVKFNLNIKEPEGSPVVRDKSKIGKEGTKSTSKTTSTASPGPGFSPIPSQENEAPLFAANEKQIGSSLYVRLD